MPAPHISTTANHDTGVPEVLTVRQAAILDFIETTVRAQGYPPTLREIGTAVGLSSPSSVRYQVVTLEAKGYLHRDAARPRAYAISDTATPPDAVLAEHIRQAAADVPLPPEYTEGHFPLRMTGEAMREAAIRDGDILIISTHHSAANDDLVAALIDGYATVRQLRHDSDGRAWLTARADGYPDYPAEAAVVLGRVATMLRHL